MNKLDILLLCNRPAKNAGASTFIDHLDAFINFSQHNFYCLSFLGKLPRKLDLHRFDIIVIHYSVFLSFSSEYFLNSQSRQRIRDFPGLKVLFVQDEYRGVNAVIENMKSMRIHVLFTCVPDGEIEKVYPSKALPGLRKINTLTGYAPKALVTRDVLRIKDRPIDVGYRTRKLPYWLGELGYEKIQIAEKFVAHAADAGLRLDISYQESRRIYGEKWIDFVSSCKVMLGTESGASVFDFSGELEQIVSRYEQEHPEAGFAEIQEKFLRPYEGKVRLNQISPRCFEAAALRTAMLLYEGDYSGILKPWRHYIPLNKDFSNIEEVIRILRDDEKLQSIADCAFAEIAQNPEYGYEKFMSDFDRVVGEEVSAVQMPSTRRRYTKSLYYLHLVLSLSYLLARIGSMLLQHLVMGTPLRRILYDVWDGISLEKRRAIRPLLRIMGK
ncbi:MAG: hypothetical protein GTO24_04820 [candidate division Zixibacteria bacterium]|nr:hypothetical protein [candidate division Zixibacteria bacterium]